MTITVEIPEELMLSLSTLPPELVQRYVTSFVVSGLRRVAKKNNWELREHDESCVAIIESDQQYQYGNKMTLEEAKDRFSRETSSPSMNILVNEVE